MDPVTVLVTKVLVVEVTVDSVPVVEPVVAAGTGDVEGTGRTVVAVAPGAATVVVEAALVGVVLVGTGATVIVPLFVVDEVLLRRVRS